jgi:hypothetical protein
MEVTEVHELPDECVKYIAEGREYQIVTIGRGDSDIGKVEIECEYSVTEYTDSEDESEDEKMSCCDTHRGQDIKAVHLCKYCDYGLCKDCFEGGRGQMMFCKPCEDLDDGEYRCFDCRFPSDEDELSDLGLGLSDCER